MTYKNQAAFNNNQAEVETTLVLDNAGLVEFSTIKEYNHVTQLYEERTQSFEYDSLNRVTKTIDPNGHITQTFYNSVNQVEKVIDAEGNVTRNEHDHLGNVVKAIQEYRDANGDYVKESTITNVYENGSELKQYIDDAGNITEYSYDIHSRLETTKLPGNDNLIYTQLYNAMAQVTQATMPDGTVVNNVYNDYTQLESVTVTKGTNVSANYGADYYFYEYNPLKQLQQVTCKKGGALGTQISQLGYLYDSSGRVIAESQKHGSLPAKTIQSKFFDAQNKNQLVHPSGTVIEYRRNELGQLHQIAKNNVVVKENTFVGGKQARIQRGPLTQSLVYGNGNELLTSKYQNGNQTIVDYTLGYNKVYYKNFEKRNHESGIGDRYKYDSVYHLIETAYDAPLPEINANGYVKKEAVDYSTTDFRNSIIKFDSLGIIDQKFYQPNALHQAVEIDTVQGVNGANRSYNRNGNLTQNETGDLYEFDYANRLVKVSTKDANNLPIDVVFTYDCSGRKIQKTVTQTNTNTVIVDEHYYYSGEEVIAEYNSSDVLLRSYVLGERIDIPVVVTEGLYDYYFVYDTHGSVIAITNANGIVEEKYKYDAHGNFEILIDSAFVSNRYFYSARDWEAEIKLYHNRARFYDPQNGFFIQRDPLGYVDGSNPYLYTSGNSVNYADPLGLGKESSLKALITLFGISGKLSQLEHAAMLTRLYGREITRLKFAVSGMRAKYGVDLTSDTIKSYYKSTSAANRAALDAGIEYSAKGIPNFERFVPKLINAQGKEAYAIKTITATGDSAKDIAAAEKAFFGGAKTPKGWTWHHADYLEDSDQFVMQLVETPLHNGIGHSGAFAYREGLLKLQAMKDAVGGSAAYFSINFLAANQIRMVDDANNNEKQPSLFTRISAASGDVADWFTFGYWSHLWAGPMTPDVTQDEIDAWSREADQRRKIEKEEFDKLPKVNPSSITITDDFKMTNYIGK